MRVLSRTWSMVHGTLVASALLGLLGGCGGLGPDGPPSPLDAMRQDIAAYDQLTTSLLQNSAQFAGKQFSSQEAIGNQLFYLDSSGFDPRLHRFDAATGAHQDYTFSLGAGDAANYRASDALIVTARNTGSMVEYNAYAPDAASKLVGSTTLMAPSGAKWWAYAVSGGDVYMVTADPASSITTLLKWTPGGSPQALFTLESATGQTRLGEFLDFGVDGDTLVFIESGRIWRGSLAQKRATWLRNMTQVVGGHVEFEADGVAFTAGPKWYFFQNANMTLLDLGMKIHDNPYRLNDTFNGIHYYDSDSNGYSRWGNYMVYIGSSGVFAYDVVRDVVKPVLLEPREAEVRTVYRYPVATTNGQLFVTGLQSTSGSVGAEGPIFRLDLTQVLK